MNLLKGQKITVHEKVFTGDIVKGEPLYNTIIKEFKDVIVQSLSLNSESAPLLPLDREILRIHLKNNQNVDTIGSSVFIDDIEYIVTMISRKTPQSLLPYNHHIVVEGNDG